ncbi:MAG: N-acetyltransferase [Alphaproteobacteria bacterium]|nr:N-acetyltransferase [Alphaproteobacteria bacterium]
MITIDRERPFDGAAIEALLDSAFGPERVTKSSYALRENNHPVPSLSFVARQDERLVGTIRFWPIQVQDMLSGRRLDALLLGPLAIAPDLQGKGTGGQLMARGVAAANAEGHQRILLVGDIGYYSKFGFEPVLPRYITLPGGKDARRLLVRQPATISSLPTVGKLVVPAPVPAIHMPVPLVA